MTLFERPFKCLDWYVVLLCVIWRILLFDCIVHFVTFYRFAWNQTCLISCYRMMLFCNFWWKDECIVHCINHMFFIGLSIKCWQLVSFCPKPDFCVIACCWLRDDALMHSFWWLKTLLWFPTFTFLCSFLCLSSVQMSSLLDKKVKCSVVKGHVI